ncbi:MAG: aminoacyl-tRNA hydrolase [Acidobacteria bacterium]|nr:MAG: aminoacyl-tRNA hydrolase [Acidobacteriota bacterium]
MWIIVGLGNPGEQYARTRHNIGFMVVDRLADHLTTALSRSECEALIGETKWHGETMVLTKPQTYMNRSGRAVACLLDHYHASPQQLIVISDDFALPLGTLRLRPKGGDGGHNGLKSIIETLGTTDFPRLRLGIGPRREAIVDPVDFVLSEFHQEEWKDVEDMIRRGKQAILLAVERGLEKAMTAYNQ